jgi:hypothetical protein
MRHPNLKPTGNKPDRRKQEEGIIDETNHK